ncbi:unnamed protein product [Caretta caretta]
MLNTFYQDIFSKDPVHKQQAKSKWLSSFQKLCEIFQKHAPVALSKRLPLHYLKQKPDFITLISMKRVLAKEKDRINPISNRSHACYLERLCNDFQKIVITHFNRSSIGEHHLLGAGVGHRRSAICGGWDGMEEEKKLCSWDLRAIIQFVGITGESRNIRLALLSLCYQIAYIYNVSINLSEYYYLGCRLLHCLGKHGECWEDVKVFDLTDSCQRLHQVHISSEDIPIHKDHSILVSNNSVKDYVLFAYRNGKEALVFSARKGEVVAKLTSQEPVAAIQGVAVTKEYFLVIFRSFCNGENYLRSWNLASKINDQSLTSTANKGKKRKQMEFRRLGDPSSSGLEHTGRAVWSFHSCHPCDRCSLIMQDHNMKQHNEPQLSSSRTLLTYDLLKKKYIKKKTGLYIISCQNNEYKILEGGLLFGLSENRDHFVIWNMETGFVKDRIKPEYKDQAPPQPILLGHLLSKDTRTLYKDILSKRKRGKGTTVFQMPWERRNESKTAKKRWLENEVKQELEKLQQLANEKYNAIDQYLLSGDEKVKK